jgi:CAAX prenyl protease-like protein
MRIAHLPAIARIVPFACYIAVLALEGQAHTLFSGFDVRWLYPLKILLVVGMLAAFRRFYTELCSFEFSLGDAALSLGVGLAVFALWIGLDVSWAVLGDAGTGYDPRNEAGQIDWLLAGARLAGAALVVPPMEELFWRSFVMRWLDRSDFLDLDPAAVTWRAVLISSVVFGFEHHQWLAGIVAGLAYAWLYRRTRQLHYAVFAHAITNGVLGVWVLATGQWRYW